MQRDGYLHFYVTKAARRKLPARDPAEALCSLARERVRARVSAVFRTPVVVRKTRAVILNSLADLPNVTRATHKAGA